MTLTLSSLDSQKSLVTDMPLITRIAGIRVELERRVNKFAEIDEPFVTWYEHENHELFGLGLVDGVDLEEDARAMGALMLWALQDKTVEWRQDRTDALTDAKRKAYFDLEGANPRWSTVRGMENMLDTAKPDWRER